METYKGKVSYIGSTNFNGTTLYSLALSGQDGFFLCGSNKPDAQKGQMVQFLADPNSKNKVDMNSFENLGYPDDKSATKTSGATNKGGSMSKNDYWEKKAEGDEQRELTMALENARYSAIQFITLAEKLDAVPLPAKKADKLPALEEMLSEYTDKFFRDNLTAKAPDFGIDSPNEEPADSTSEDDLDLDDFDELE